MFDTLQDRLHGLHAIVVQAHLRAEQALFVPDQDAGGAGTALGGQGQALEVGGICHLRQALPGKGRDRSGVCGSAIRGAGLDMVSRLAAIRERLGLDYAIIGVGGVVAPEDYRAYRAAGADAVMSATGAMWDAELARKIKADD